ncbi:MAG: CDP-diacylglycerol--serine O-phosphatidyltransferase [Candidatus Woesearchaeota archaeon]
MNIFRKNHIPTWLTLGNLAGGFLAILAIIDNNIPLAMYLIGIALFFDVIDGYVARRFNWQSDMGVELDSLADAVSFVIAPSLLAYLTLLNEASPIPSLFMAGCGILRLAKFNVTKGKDHFIGLPTPVHTIFIFSLYFVNLQIWLIALIMIISSYTMISPLKYPALKKGHFQHYKQRGLILALIAALLLALSNYIGLILASILIYALFLAILIPLNLDKKLKKPSALYIFNSGFIAAVVISYLINPIIPVIYAIAAAPLIQVAIDGKWNLY